jgi:hypothetical protein
MKSQIIKPLEKTEYNFSKEVDIVNVASKELVPNREYLHINNYGDVFMCKCEDYFLHLEKKATIIKKHFRESDVQMEREYLKVSCAQDVNRAVRNLIAILRLEGCRYIYRTSTDNISVKVSDKKDVVEITASLRMSLFGKRDQEISAITMIF